MNQEIHPEDDFLAELRADIRLAWRLALSLSIAVVVPLIGPAILTRSIRQFDLYEGISVLFVPILYLLAGAHICSSRTSVFGKCTGRPGLRKVVTGYKTTYIIALLLLCFYQAFITIVLSPGGPDELKGTFWLCTVIFYPPYIALIVASELYLRNARRLASVARRAAAT